MNSQKRRRGGFTLVEIMISMAILSVMVLGIMQAYLQYYKAAFVNENRNMINRDMRQLTGKLTEDGRQANYFLLYRSHEAADHNESKDRLLDGRAGDMLLLVYSDLDAINLGVDQGMPVKRIIGYFRDAPSDDTLETGPVRRFVIEFDPTIAPEDIEDNLPTATQMADFPEVIELSRGLADGRLFYNFWGRSVMVNGQIYHGNQAKRITETYNFSISPRG